jgi:tRNA 2-thiouridine synthesizing protein A
MPDKTMDLKGLACPLPILKAKKALSELPKGATLEVLATDPGSVADFTAFSEATGNPIVERSENAGIYRFVLKRSA